MIHTNFRNLHQGGQKTDRLDRVESSRSQAKYVFLSLRCIAAVANIVTVVHYIISMLETICE